VTEIDALYERFLDLQCYVGWTQEDAAALAALRSVLEPHFPALIDDFYAEVDRHEGTRKVITGGAEQVERLKGTLLAWLADLFSAPRDRDYVARRWSAGVRHVAIGLAQVYTNAALSRMRAGLVRALDDAHPRVPAAAARALQKALDLDLSLIEHAYESEHTRHREQAERLATLQEARERLAQILDAAGEGICGLDVEGRTTFINPAGAAMLGWEPEALVGKLQHDVIHHTRRDGSPYPPESCPIHAAFRNGERHEVSDELFWRKDGTSFAVECLARSIGRDGDVVGAVVTFRDVTEKRELEAHTALVEDRQRRALAADLHDDVGQLHSLLSIKCRALRDLAQGSEFIEPIREIEELAREAGERITSLSFELSPPLLHDVGLAAAAHWLADHMKQRYGLGIELASDGEMDDLDEPVRIVLFRALRELLINVAKHAGAQGARVEMGWRGDSVVVRVEDDGKGFDPDAPYSRFGLVNLRARVEQLGGSLLIASAPGRGTTASAVLPRTRAGAR
jgi:PAS domain S-box-containing protein